MMQGHGPIVNIEIEIPSPMGAFKLELKLVLTPVTVAWSIFLMKKPLVVSLGHNRQ